MTAHWAEPGCYPVAEGIHRIPLELPQDGLRAVNVYTLDTDDGLVLIDGGWHRPHTYRELSDGLARIGRSPGEIHDVLVTHIHRDHYTFAVELRRRTGCRVQLGAAESGGLQEIRELGNNVPESSLRELRRAGAAGIAARAHAESVGEPFDPADWEAPDHWLRPGPLRLGGHDLEVLATPGHTKGHVVFHDPARRLLFTGDHLLPTITPSIGFELGVWELPLANFLHSLEMLRDNDDQTMLPAHGPDGGSVGRRARELLDHHDRRFGQIRAAVTELAPCTGLEVARALSWTRRERPFSTLDTFNQMVATCETMAHLDVLAARNTIGAEERDGVNIYSAQP
ncbi:MBL fold metallo-hydrolase [Nocardia jinanensis]|uniref:MBL fold metallo-hydrolase n=1 Tax=Nocardia jinanensis TaxID=382504 RepID=A0A917R6D6_9NOCA|nr:MBL fold metallo-hydrolase [Nocardia jinanensis]GGK91025.1 MBL fold metallo-hydrolase [Nocardia jinanensis]